MTQFAGSCSHDVDARSTVHVYVDETWGQDSVAKIENRRMGWNFRLSTRRHRGDESVLNKKKWFPNLFLRSIQAFSAEDDHDCGMFPVRLGFAFSVTRKSQRQTLPWYWHQNRRSKECTVVVWVNSEESEYPAIAHVESGLHMADSSGIRPAATPLGTCTLSGGI